MPPEKKRGGSIQQTPHKKKEMENPFSCPFISTHTHDVGSGGAALTVDDDELYFCPQPKKERGGGKCSSSFCRRLSYMYTHLSKNIFLKCYFFFWLASGGPVWLLLEGEKSIGDVGNDTPRGEDNPSAGKKGTQRKRYYTK